MFDKKAILFWIFLLATVLLFILSFSCQNNLDDFFSASLYLFILSSDFSKIFLIYIFCISIYFAFIKYQQSKIESAFLFVFISILFNPFYSFKFESDFQNIIEFVAAGFFGYFTYQVYRENIIKQR